MNKCPICLEENCPSITHGYDCPEATPLKDPRSLEQGQGLFLLGPILIGIVLLFAKC